MIVPSPIVAGLVVALVQAVAAPKMTIRFVQMGGHPSIHRCETTLFLPDLRFLTNSVTVTCELSETLGEKDPRVYRQIPLSVEDGLKYRRLVADADLFGGGYVGERTRLCEECGLAYLEVRVDAKEAILLVGFNPTFESGARAVLVEFLSTTQAQVVNQELAARRKQ
jgi:hypothetical protein